jgi:hypothetical protein
VALNSDRCKLRFFLSSFCFRDILLGRAFSQQREIVLYVNLGLTLAMTVVSIVKGGILRWHVAFAATALLLVWLIVAAVSAAV